ncbi:GNAT family N-acetyltransferase [Oribacterium sp. C9]|uniref:GNAT family N-acetyltransferase n=1 Tax=Oribacterium sp. C9 TaxID=1943579 RepID=UPI00098F2303|nr:GNAT family N-acetyltransferase [Oribacterium sp. C9]OON87517.1 GNAT family N-acetyltransferase [Oribacterium sp. C9]
MLRLRPYISKDSETVLSWIKDEETFYKWTAGILGTYPITGEQFNAVSEFMAFTAIEDDEPVGFFTMRRPGNSFDELMFGFVIVDPKHRGLSYGKRMLLLGLKFAKEIYGARRVTLGVFENNEPAYYCYRAAGFREGKSDEVKVYKILGEIWRCRELEYICSDDLKDETKEVYRVMLNSLVTF